MTVHAFRVHPHSYQWARLQFELYGSFGFYGNGDASTRYSNLNITHNQLNLALMFSGSNTLLSSGMLLSHSRMSESPSTTSNATLDQTRASRRLKQQDR
jgi:hypothetical protein